LLALTRIPALPVSFFICFDVVRLCGIGLCLIYLCELFFGWRLLDATDGNAGWLANHAIDHGFLALLGVVLILVSLHVRAAIKPGLRRSAEMPAGRVPAFFRRSRFLVLLLAGLYISLVPVLVFSDQAIADVALSSVTRQYEQQRAIIETIARSRKLEDAIAALRLYQRTYPVRVAIMPAQLSDMEVLVPRLMAQAEMMKKQQIFQANFNSRQKHRRLIIITLLYAVMFVALWLAWP